MQASGFKQFFSDIKSKLVAASELKQGYDLDQIEYLIKVVDYFLMGKVQINSHNMSIFMDEIITAAIMQIDMELLNMVNSFSYSIGDEDEISLRHD